MRQRMVVDPNEDEDYAGGERLSMHAPMRTCVGCRHVSARKRSSCAHFASTANPCRPCDPSLRPGTPRAQVRSSRAYLCPSRSCLSQAVRRGGFARAFQAGPVTADVDTLWAALSESK
jgi:predicted RNA-binding protein YlxR (DUF448 family)